MHTNKKKAPTVSLRIKSDYWWIKSTYCLLALLLTVGHGPMLFSSVNSCDKNEPQVVSPTRVDLIHLETTIDDKSPTFRSLSVKRVNAAFIHTAFHKAHSFFLAPAVTGKLDHALARAHLAQETDNDCSKIVAKIQPLAPQTTLVNTADTPGVKTANPVYDASISHLSLMGALPVAVLNTRNPAYTAIPTGANQTIALVADPVFGTLVLTNVVQLKDSTGADTGGISGIAASSKLIFAAVNQTGNAFFGGANSGIALLAPTKTNLSPLDATTGLAGNVATGIVGPAGTNIVSPLGDNVILHWDRILQRLFIGLNVDNKGGGTSTANGLLVGRLGAATAPALTIESAMPDVMTADLALGSDHIIGHKKSANSALKVFIQHIKTMHTSTGKVYVIVNGQVQATGNNTPTKKVFALPLVHKQFPGTPLANNNDIGKITKKGNPDQDAVVTAGGDAVKANEPAAQVGGGVDAPAAIIGMFVHADSVYVHTIDDTKATTRGIFQSSALFGTNGLIRGWTPWQRVMGAPDQVWGAGLDLPTAQFWYLTKTDTDGDTVKVTQWNHKDNNLLGNLITKLTTEFPCCSAGIHQLFNFDEQTPGFKTNEFSMMVATGLGKVALIQTGKLDGGFFAPTSGADFVGGALADNVKVFSPQVLKDIGPICCADVSRFPSVSSLLFVGGYNGVAVLSKSDGLGWVNLDDAQFTAFPGDFTFKKLGSFKHVHKIVATRDHLYILTPQALYRIDLSTNKFKSISPTPLGAEVIATPQSLGLSACDSLLDFVVSSKLGLLATTAGLFRTVNDGDVQATIPEANKWIEIKTKAGFSLGPVTHLSFQSKIKGSFEEGGNLYTVAGNMSTDLATIVRFDIKDTSGPEIDDDTVAPICELKEAIDDPIRDYYYPFGEMRSAFVTDGTFGFNILPRHFDNTLLVAKINMESNLTKLRRSDQSFPIGLNPTTDGLQACNYNAGIPVQNTASGAWMLPGDWVVKINE